MGSPDREGFGSLTACPHGVYATAGVERYIAIAVETTEQWRALRDVAPLDVFKAPRFDAASARRELRGEIDAALRAWCAARDGRDLERQLAESGVPASVVQRVSELYEDPQLEHRGFFVTLDHAEMGPTPYDGFVTQFSAKGEMLHKAAPRLGEDTEYVLRELLGLSASETAEYAAAGALS